MSRVFKYVLSFLFIFYFFGPVSFDNKTLEPYKIEVLNIVKQQCKEGEYNNPEKQLLYFKELSTDTIAECSSNYNVYYKIEVNPNYWNKYNEADKFQIIAHEMFHCLFGMDHSPDKHNFMYYSMTSIPKDITIMQMVEYLKHECGR